MITVISINTCHYSKEHYDQGSCDLFKFVTEPLNTALAAKLHTTLVWSKEWPQLSSYSSPDMEQDWAADSCFGRAVNKTVSHHLCPTCCGEKLGGGKKWFHCHWGERHAKQPPAWVVSAQSSALHFLRWWWTKCVQWATCSPQGLKCSPPTPWPSITPRSFLPNYI